MYLAYGDFLLEIFARKLCIFLLTFYISFVKLVIGGITYGKTEKNNI